MSGWWSRLWHREAPEPAKLHPAAELVIDLLDLSAGWKHDDYRLWHRECGVSMWIANEFYGFDLAIDDKPVKIDGRTVGLDAHSKRILWDRVQAYLNGALVARDSADLAAFAQRVTKRLIAEHKLPADPA